MDYTITVNDTDGKILANEIADFKVWIEAAAAGKIASCKGRFFSEWETKLRADPSVASIPADDTEFVNLVVARSDYENRAARDAEEEASKP